MQLLKQTFAVLASAALLTLGSGCKPEPVTTDPTPTAEETCMVESIKQNGLDVEGFEYDAQHKPIKYRVYNNGGLYVYYTLSYTNGKLSSLIRYNSANIADQNMEFIYSANGKLLQQKIYSSNGVLATRYDYEYDASQRVNRLAYFYSASAGVLTENGYTLYDYSGADMRPLRERQFSTGASSSSSVRSYTYDGNNNITNESYSYGSSGSYTTTARTFDNKKSALIGFAGFGENNYTGTTIPVRTASKNNATSVITTNFDSNGNQTSRNVVNYTYEYNSKGYPTKMNTIPTSASSTNSTTDFTYHCH